MKSVALQSYFEINQATYEGLIGEILTEIESRVVERPSKELTEARRTYLESAIAKGHELSKVPDDLATMNIAALHRATRTLPDKQAPGWENKVAELSASDRKNFSDAAQKRSQENRWDNLFPNGKNDIALSFSGQEVAQSVDDKIRAYIANHNSQAVTLLAEAREQDIAALQTNPSARPLAGRSILQRQIRLVERTDETGKRLPAQLQSLNPTKSTQENEIWENGPNFSKFLQDHYAWDLLDIVQLAAEPRGGIQNPGANVVPRHTLRSIAHQSHVHTDSLYDADRLLIVVSRDPQKIGEMSTGQRWRSCMASNGINYHFVPADIEKGSLVAYVVHEDDHDARYPLMRQMLKPFRNNKGEAILVPARIYGGEGNASSRTRDALQRALMTFVLQQNHDKSGKFDMDNSLYGDAQATTVMMKESWSPEEVTSAMIAYQESALLEWTTEVNNNRQLLAKGERGAHKEDPAVNIKKLRSKIQRLFINTDIAIGLPRMFFRTMQSSSVGATPRAKEVYEVAISNDTIRIRATAFAALMKKDFKAWESAAEELPGKLKIQMIMSAMAIADNKATQDFAEKAWHYETMPCLAADRTGMSQKQRQSNYDEALSIADELCKATDDNGILVGITALPTADAQCRLADLYLTRFKTTPQLSTACRRIIADNLPHIKSVSEGCDLAGNVLFAPRSTPDSADSTRKAEAYLLTNFDTGVTPTLNRGIAINLLASGCSSEALFKKAERVVIDILSDPNNNISFESKSNLAAHVSSRGGTEIIDAKHRIGIIHLNNIAENFPKLGDKPAYLRQLSFDLYSYRDTPQVQDQLAVFLLDNVSNIPHFRKRVEVIDNILKNTPDKSLVKDRAKAMLVADYRSVFSAEGDLDVIKSSAYDVSSFQGFPYIQEQIVAVLLKYISRLTKPKDRVAALSHIRTQLSERSRLERKTKRLLFLHRGLAFSEAALNVVGRAWRADHASELLKLFKQASSFAERKTDRVAHRQISRRPALSSFSHTR